MYSPYNPPISPIRKRNQWEQAVLFIQSLHILSDG